MNAKKKFRDPRTLSELIGIAKDYKNPDNPLEYQSVCKITEDYIKLVHKKYDNFKFRLDESMQEGLMATIYGDYQNGKYLYAGKKRRR